jgi:predicted transcriptional regulator
VLKHATRRRACAPIILAGLETMYVTYIVRRTQIYLDDEQDRRLDERARALGTTKSAIIREAIDGLLAAAEPNPNAGLIRLRAAVAEATGAAGHLPSGNAYVDAVRRADQDRERRLQKRRVR